MFCQVSRTPANHKTQRDKWDLCQLSFVTQGDEGIDLRGAAGGEEAGAQANSDDEGCDRTERPWIRGGDAPDLARQETREGETGEESEGNSCCKQARTLCENHL